MNTAESSHALIRRGIVGIYHNVSREYHHRYPVACHRDENLVL